MNAGIRFPGEAVRQHAATVGGVADQMAQARSTVREATMDARAYGEICQFLPGLLSPLFTGVGEVMSSAIDALSETALELAATADVIEAADADSATRLTDAVRDSEPRS